MGASSPCETILNRSVSYLDNLTLLRVGQIDPSQLRSLCFSIARSIDYAIANNAVPSKAHSVPSVIKQLCKLKHSHRLKAALTVLMITVKNACKAGWFPEKDAEELRSLANEIGNDFFGDANIGQSNSLTTITTVMERFFPRLKLGEIIASVEVKPGYGVFAIDFNILKTIEHAPQEKIHDLPLQRLLVAQTDNIETSACIISPPQVNFLVNGRAVNGRTNVFMDTGPQLPTNITHLLKLGSNLLQAIGNFNGHYVIAVAVMGTVPSPDSSVLQDHIQPVVSTVDSDSDIIEGPSRISLNCPISYTRIKVPVKGHSCKHLQCFDFYNFIDINSRRPSWRCPHCNQYICFLDIRVDQNMLKVIGEVAENVTEVIISADGSWKAILENDHGDGQPLDDSLNHQNERPQEESTAPSDVLDLTEVDDDMDICNLETEDRKPCLGNKNQPVSSSFDISSGMNMNSLNQNLAAVLDDDFWSRIVSDGILTSNAGSDSPIGNSMHPPGFAGIMQSAVLTDVVSPVFNHGVGVPGHANFSSPAFYDQNNLQIQASNLNENNQYGRMASISRPVSRTPIAVQALPAQSQAAGQQYTSRTPIISSVPQVGQSIPINRDGLNTLSRDLDSRQQYSRHHGDSPHAMNRSPYHHSHTVQNRDPQDRSFTPGQSVQASTSLRPSTGRLTDFQNSHLQRALRMSHFRNQNSSSVLPSMAFTRPTSQVGGGYGGSVYTSPISPHARMMAGSQRVEMIRQPSSMSLQNQTSRSPHSPQTTPDGLRRPTGELRNVGGLSQPVTMAAGSVDQSVEQNWQPAGRMRGSLSGRAYSDAYGVIIQPTQPVQSTRPPPHLTHTLPNVPSTQSPRSNGLDTHVPRT